MVPRDETISKAHWAPIKINEVVFSPPTLDPQLPPLILFLESRSTYFSRDNRVDRVFNPFFFFLRMRCKRYAIKSIILSYSLFTFDNKSDYSFYAVQWNSCILFYMNFYIPNNNIIINFNWTSIVWIIFECHIRTNFFIIIRNVFCIIDIK